MRCSQLYKPQDFSVLSWPMVQPDNGMIRWHIVNFTPDMEKFKVVLAFQQALEKIQIGFDKIFPVGRYITLEPTDDFHAAHIRYFFVNPGVTEQKYIISDGTEYTLINKWPFSGPGEVLAHRPAPTRQNPKAHEVHFDESEHWSDMTKVGHTNLMAVVIHETLHVLDLGHSEVQEAVMAPYYDGRKLDLRADDLQGLMKVWGPYKETLAGRPGGDKRGCLYSIFT